MAIYHNLWQYGIACGHLVYFVPFWYVWTKKNLATMHVCRENYLMLCYFAAKQPQIKATEVIRACDELCLRLNDFVSIFYDRYSGAKNPR
jgi:hypothetical protein